MKLTDEKTLKMLNKVRSHELEEMLETYPEDERSGRTDEEMLLNELSYLLEKYEGGGYIQAEDFQRAKRILSETKYGKVMPYYMPACRPKYKEWEIEDAKNMVNEYNRLKRLYIKLTGE